MEFSFENISFYLVLILPGLISLKIFHLIVPIHQKESSNDILDGLFYSSINALILVPVYFIMLYLEDTLGILIYFILYALMLLVSIFFPFAIYKIRTKGYISNKLLLPYATSWDYYFGLREPCFVLIHLKDGKKVGGYYGQNSYASASPKEGDIYIEKVFKINKDSTFGDPISESSGLLITKENYDFIELYKINKGEKNE